MGRCATHFFFAFAFAFAFAFELMSDQSWQMFGPHDKTVPTDVCGCRAGVACVIAEQVRPCSH